MSSALILGGGFGGLAAAHELRRAAPDVELTVISGSDHFAMGLAKLWDLTGLRPLTEGRRPLIALERAGVRFVHATVESVDPTSREVRTSAGDYTADGLIVAMGSRPEPLHVSQLDAVSSHDLYDADGLHASRVALSRIQTGRIVVAVMGVPFKCPPAPYEAAFLIDEHLKRRGVRDSVEVVVATPQPATLPAAGPEASALVLKLLVERGIDVRLEHRAPKVFSTARSVTFDTGEELTFDLLYAVPADAPLEALADSEISAETGWILPDRASLETVFDRVYAVGDCTFIETATKPLPKAGVFAEAQGIVAARNLAADFGAGDGDQYGGEGHCFLEVGATDAIHVRGNFYAEPKPEVEVVPPNPETAAAKREYESSRLDEWLPVRE